MVDGRGDGSTERDAGTRDVGAPGDEAAVRSATRTALRWLTARARTEREVRERLLRDRVPAAVVDQVLAQLRAWGYVDDRRLALEAAEAARVRHVGPRRLRAELLRRGVPEAVVHDALAATWPAEIEREAAWELARRRWAQLVAGSPAAAGPDPSRREAGTDPADGSGGAGEAATGGPRHPAAAGDPAPPAGPPGRPLGRGSARQRAAARLYRFLVGRGFAAEVAEEIVRRLAGEED
ncbi:MAG TPA: RecX family transcriptional regulator [Thermaerobacter sp.]